MSILLTDEQGIAADHSILLEVLRLKAYEYLKDELVKAMGDDMKKIATDAVAQWAEVRLSINPSVQFSDLNISIAFVEHIVKTVMRDSPIKITVKE